MAETVFVVEKQGENAILRASQCPTFTSFLAAIRGKFTDLLTDDFIIKFILEQPNQLSSVESQQDFENVILLCQNWKRCVVYFTIPENFTTANSGTNLLSAPGNENAPTQKRNSKRKLPEDERNEGATSSITIYNVDAEQDSRSLLNSSSGKRKLREEESNEDECATSGMPQKDSRLLLSADWANKITHVEQEFRDGVQEFRRELAMYASKVGFKFKYTRNDATYVSAHCRERDKVGCKWFVKGGIDNINKLSFVIREANLVHTCRLSAKGASRRLGAQLLGNLVQEKVQTNPKISATQIQDHLLNDYGLTVSYEKVWRGLEVARANIFGYGSYKDSYNELDWYRNAIIKTNPGSHVTLETEDGTNRFKRFFVAFKGSLHGFKSCRPMLFVDATSMKKRCKGTLLSGTAKDGNNGLFPVAFAIVDGENSNNWVWFLSKLRDVIEHEKEIMYLSDRASGLLTAFNIVWERPLHFFCLYHLMKYLKRMYYGKKFSDAFKNKMCQRLKDAAYAPDRCLFNTAIAEFQKRGGETAVHFLNDLPVEKWALAFAPDLLRYGELTSDADESFNDWILDACSMPVTYILDCISTQLVQWFAERREEESKWTGALTPKMEEMWDALERLGRSWTISSTTIEGVFNVLSNPPCTVDLNRRACTCYQWQVSGFPCCHAIVCINQAAWWNIRGIVDECFFNDTYKLIYESNIEAIPTRGKNEDVDLNAPAILPPVTRKDKGKPSEKQVLSEEEEKRKKFHCGRCGEIGMHAWVTCNDALDE